MASEKTKRKSTFQSFECDSSPIAPGTTNHARLPRDGEPDPLPRRAWWLIGAAAAAALIVGVLIGRFL
jgi:hypothetical protein